MSHCFLYGFILDRPSNDQPLTSDQIDHWHTDDGLLWVHLNYTTREAQDWINNSNLPDSAKSLLLTSHAHTGAHQTREGLLLSLYAINLKASPKEEDMTPVRGYFSPHRIVTVSNQTTAAISSLANHIQEGFGPENTGSFITTLCDRLANHKITLIDLLDDRVTDLEERVLTEHDPALRNDIAVIRRQAVYIRRYVAPQRDALIKLITIETPLLSRADRQKLHDIKDKLTHVINDLDAIRERANVTQEELMILQSDALNQRVYFLSLVTTIFLPLTFLTGLLGVNLAGIPGSQDERAFFIFCSMLVLLFVLQLMYFYRRKWL
ncbi:zinc transporter ZntB [Kistimonas scapharcae]|uniref:Zinc transporter ZntB n=1 Tax=Kistimonas scapharcae TaxID=1036133 RepID=A0ABP8VB79_9GAMM